MWQAVLRSSDSDGKSMRESCLSSCPRHECDSSQFLVSAVRFPTDRERRFLRVLLDHVLERLHLPVKYK